MIEGYFRRRALKLILAVLTASSILIYLSVSNSSTISNIHFYVYKHFRLDNDDEQLPKTFDQSREENLVESKDKGFLSTIGFINSPYLNLEPIRSSNVLILMILSKATNIEVRDAIRRTWGFNRQYRNDETRIRLFFVVGTEDLMIQRIQMEQIVFDDIIQVTIPDLFSFVAYKEIAAMKWMRTYLPEKQFYFKTEDYVILNMNTFIHSFVPLIENVAQQELVIGWFGTEHLVQRGKYQKFDNVTEHSSNNGIMYATNFLYAITSTAVDRILRILDQIELIEYPGDPFVTGILRDAAGVKIINLPNISTELTYELANGACTAALKKNQKLLVCTTSLYIGSKNSMYEYFDAWNILIGQRSN